VDADDVVGRLGAADRDHRVLLELAAAGGSELEILLTEEVQHLDRSLAVGAELDVLLDLERDHDLVALELHLIDATGTDATDLDDVAVAEAAGIVELRAVLGAGEPRELGEVEGGGHHQEHHHQGDRSEPQDLGVRVAPHDWHLSAVEWNRMLLSSRVSASTPGMSLSLGNRISPENSHR